MSTAVRAIRRNASIALLALLATIGAVLAGSVVSAPGAAAAPCQTCPDDPPPPPGHPQPRYEVWYPSGAFDTNLYIHATEDAVDDEAYLTVNGTTMWGPHSVHYQGPSTGPGNGRYNVPFRAVIYGSAFDIAMYDEDWPDPDDNLGSFHYLLPNLNAGPTVYGLSLRFDADSADYSLIQHHPGLLTRAGGPRGGPLPGPASRDGTTVPGGGGGTARCTAWTTRTCGTRWMAATR
jgi:hypothetical protein